MLRGLPESQARVIPMPFARIISFRKRAWVDDGKLDPAVAIALMVVLCVLSWALILFLILAPAQARAETWLAGTVASYHFDREPSYNEQNWGLGVEHGVAPDVRIFGGFYKNSFYQPSRYAGASYMPLVFGPLHVGLAAGVVDGYPKHDGRPLPVVTPLLAFEFRNVGFNLIALPSTSTGKQTGVIGLQLKLRVLE